MAPPCPVPRPVAICQDTELIGAPFYLMEWVDGVVFRTSEDARLLSPAQAGQVCEDFAAMLATIHGLDVSAVGLDGFGKPEGYMARQLARWQRQWDLSVTREMPGYDELVSRLAAGLPAEDGPRAGGTAGTLVHGDFRIDNMLIRPGAGAADRRGRGLGDVHPWRPSRRPRAVPGLLDRSGGGGSAAAWHAGRR